MIPTDLLRNVTDVYVHRASLQDACSDGRATGYILHDALPTVNVHEVAYSSRAHRNIVPRKGLLFGDLSPHRSQIEALKPFDPIILDHHKSAADILASFPHSVYADEAKEPGVSGAVLAFTEVWLPIRGVKRCERCRHWKLWQSCTCPPFKAMRELATLVGIRDTWQKDHPRFKEAGDLCEFLVFAPLSTLFQMTPQEVLARGREMGPLLRARVIDEAKRAVETGTHLESGGHKLLLFSNTHLSSDASTFAPEDTITCGYDMVHDGEEMRIQFSLRSRNGLNLIPVVQKFGGGGHKAAAGFSVEVTLNWYRDPVSILRGAFANVP